MTLLRAKDIAKMEKKEREEKLKDFKMELIKANVTANKTGAKTKEIKRAISRLITFSKSSVKAEKELKKQEK